jgi:hypothetical protein
MKHETIMLMQATLTEMGVELEVIAIATLGAMYASSFNVVVRGVAMYKSRTGDMMEFDFSESGKSVIFADE